MLAAARQLRWLDEDFATSTVVVHIVRHQHAFAADVPDSASAAEPCRLRDDLAFHLPVAGGADRDGDVVEQCGRVRAITEFTFRRLLNQRTSAERHHEAHQEHQQAEDESTKPASLTGVSLKFEPMRRSAPMHGKERSREAARRDDEQRLAQGRSLPEGLVMVRTRARQGRRYADVARRMIRQAAHTPIGSQSIQGEWHPRVSACRRPDGTTDRRRRNERT